ncbi:uncharacterized protein VTP21DRAFT_5821 [Calcarisporiella thermophila]|uniref:uncharacterized protein n=1 Tax=Calcarisporiella thermophila TaxID=911321 RepID=UPI0037432480
MPIQLEMERRYPAQPTERLKRACKRRYNDFSLEWEHGYLILSPDLVEKITKCSVIPRQHPPPRFPLHLCHLAGAPVPEYSTRQGRHFQRNGSPEPETLTPQSWPEVASTAKEWEKVWTSIQKRPTLPKHRTLRWRILIERVITNSTFSGHDPKCTRCNAPRDTIRHTFFECPELTNLVLGDLPEAPRTVRHAAQIIFDSVLWQIHRDRIAYHFECTRAPPETIIVRAKMDIEEAIGGELIKARKRREIELFRRR